jgi:hypothetical protein
MAKVFISSTVSKPTLGIKRQGREADHSCPSSAKVKIGAAVSPLHHKYSWREFYIVPSQLYDLSRFNLLQYGITVVPIK